MTPRRHGAHRVAGPAALAAGGPRDVVPQLIPFDSRLTARRLQEASSPTAGGLRVVMQVLWATAQAADRACSSCGTGSCGASACALERGL